jgi:hypothetical protein
MVLDDFNERREAQLVHEQAIANLAAVKEALVDADLTGLDTDGQRIIGIIGRTSIDDLGNIVISDFTDPSMAWLSRPITDSEALVIAFIGQNIISNPNQA